MTTYDATRSDHTARLASYFTQHPTPHPITVTVHPAHVLYTQQLLTRLNPHHPVTLQADFYSRTPGALSITPDDQQPQQYRVISTYTHDPNQAPPAAIVPKSQDEIVLGITRLFDVLITTDEPTEPVMPLIQLLTNAIGWTLGETPTAPVANPVHAALLTALQGEPVPT